MHPYRKTLGGVQGDAGKPGKSIDNRHIALEEQIYYESCCQRKQNVRQKKQRFREDSIVPHKRIMIRDVAPEKYELFSF